MPDKKTKPLPCPGCKHTKVRLFHWDDVTIFAECLNPLCRMSGPLGQDEVIATANWNGLPRDAFP